MAAPREGEQLVVQDPLEGPEQDPGQVAKGTLEQDLTQVTQARIILFANSCPTVFHRCLHV
jgi:hypothetical protein